LVNCKRKYRFGLFEADLASRELLRQGVRVRLPDQPFRLLAIVLERPGEVVSRDELRQKLWPANTYVEFDGSLNAALKRLRAALGDSAENPTFIETIPKRGFRFIAPVVVEDETARPATTDDVIVEDGPPKTSSPVASTELPTAPWQGRTFLVYGVVLVVVMLAGLGWYSSWHRSRPVTASASNAARPLAIRKSVAVLGFHNASGRAEDEWLAPAFAEMLSTELATGERLRLVPGEEVANLRISSPWPQTSTLGRDTTARLGTALNSDVLVLGSFTSIGKADRRQLRLDVQLQDARTGEVLNQIAQTCRSDDLFRVTSEIGTRLRERLGVPGISDTEEAGVLASLPLNREAARFYALGISKLRGFDALAAITLLEHACKADPKFSLAHLMLARAWSQLGYEQKRKEEARKALDLSVDLPQEERLLIEGDYYDSLADHERAASAYRALFELFPDSVDYGLQLEAAQAVAGHASQALETISRLRRLPPPGSDDPRIDIAESRLVHTKAEALPLLHNALTKASSQGKKLTYALARLNECMNLVYGEHPELGSGACEDAYTIYLAAGNRLLAADAVRLTADLQGSQGQTEQAMVTYQRALKMLEELGEHEKIGLVLNNMAIAFTNQGKLDRGEQLYRQAKFHFEQAGDKRNTSTALVNIADIFYLRGNLPAAAKTYEQDLDLEASLENGDPGYTLYRLADLELAQGRVQDAHRHAQLAVDATRASKYDEDRAMDELGEVLEAEGDLNGARQQYQAAVDIKKERGKPYLMAESQALLADLSLEEGHPEQTEPLLRLAIAKFEKEKADPDTTGAYTVLSRAMLMQGKLEEARTAIKHAAELGRTSTDPAVKLPIAIENARIEIASTGHGSVANTALAGARQQLRYALATARRLGYYNLECEVRLALGELELQPNPALGRSVLTQLAADAHRRGLELIARKATAAGMRLIEAASAGGPVR
jgi:DNA-binding winged helix-turn-helix (wHTH) protein/tetratricopeptide (TPR) repeat protein/TolB-like protein